MPSQNVNVAELAAERQLLLDNFNGRTVDDETIDLPGDVLF
jgi:hypothetical protein